VAAGAAHRGSPRRGAFFLWVHYYDPHAPYEPPGALAERFRTAPLRRRDRVRDTQLARLLRALERRARGRGPVVLATADHGESLGEQGEGTHGLFRL
jgi:arylsulfatase A-like enzyme